MQTFGSRPLQTKGLGASDPANGESEDKQIAPPTATTMDIVQFVRGGDVDSIYLESSYYVAADEKASKPYALFMAALKETGQNAIAKLAMHNREHIVLWRPGENGLLLHTCFTPMNCMRQTRVTPFKPEQFHDTYRENVEHLLARRRKGRKINTVKQPRKAPVIDLMDALKRSLASGKQPAAAAETSASRQSRKPAGRRHAA